MSGPLGVELLQNVAERIIVAYLGYEGAVPVELIRERVSAHGSFVDIVALAGGESRRIKVKADPYFGTDARKVADRALPFYRASADSYAFEALADTTTREPGWTLASDADDLYYYYLALTQSPDDVSALMTERDEVFFSELAVERDELVVLPMQAVRSWFDTHHAEYTPRPVMHDRGAAWCRLVPREELERAVPGARTVGAVFGQLSH